MAFLGNRAGDRVGHFDLRLAMFVSAKPFGNFLASTKDIVRGKHAKIGTWFA
jgi:hypothetical protein